MTKATKADRTRRTRPGWSGMAVAVTGLLLVAGLPGCASLPSFTPPWQRSKTEVTKADIDKDTAGLRGGPSKAGAFWHPRQDDIEAAKRLIEQKKFAEAEIAFHAVATDKKCPEQFREEAVFGEAESQRLQKKYRAAEDTYLLLFKDFPSTQYTERADRSLFEIAAHWLEGTRQQMEAAAEQREGKRWLVLPTSFIHFSEDMPTFDPEGNAIRVLEHVQMREKVLHSALGEQALLYLASVKFYRADYLDADRYFTDLYQQYPNGPKAAEAVKKSIICKQLCTGGTMYDLRTVEESRKLIHTAQTAYPEFGKDKEWIAQQLVSIHLQQADRDFRVAEFYRWTNRPGPAYFYYELVRRCYPNTPHAAKAADRIRALEKRHPDAVRQTQAGGAPGAGTPPPGQAGTLRGPAMPPVPGGLAAPRELPTSIAPPRP